MVKRFLILEFGGGGAGRDFKRFPPFKGYLRRVSKLEIVLLVNKQSKSTEKNENATHVF